MIKAKIDGKLLLLGLSNQNLKQLKKGHPIHIFGKEFGIEEDIMIIWGRTEQDIVDEISPMINGTTQIIKPAKH